MKSWKGTLQALALGWLWWVAGPAPARANYIPRLWQIEDGLPDNMVQAITQTQDGYLWVGTREGLARFDGAQFVEVAFPGKTAHPSITALHEASDGSLWIGTAGQGPFELRNGQLKSRADDFGVTNVAGIEESGDGLLWMAGSEGLVAWRNGRALPETRLREMIFRICSDRHGAIWSMGLRLRKTTLEGSTILTNEHIPVAAVRGICVDHNGAVWAGGFRGLVRMEGGQTNLFAFTNPEPRNIVITIYEDHQGQLWVGSRDGLSRFADGQFIQEVDSQGMGYVSAIFEDREQNLWVGTEKGLIRLRPRLFRGYTVNDGLSEGRINSVCAGPDGSIWIGTWGGGVDRWHEGTITVFRQTNGPSSDFIEAMGLGANGNIWVGTDYKNGVNEFRGGSWFHYPVPAGVITAVAQAGPAVWVGTQNGLFCRTNGDFVRYRISIKPAVNWINALCVSGRGGLWIGTEAGLWRMEADAAAPAPGPLSVPVIALYEDGEGTLWAGTRGSGLVRVRGRDVRVFDMARGLPSDSIYAMVEDSQQRLWFNSSRGIFQVARAELDGSPAGRPVTAIGYGRSDGIESSGQRQDSVQAGACKGADGRLWFRTMEGVVVVDPSKVSRNALAPPVAIEGLVANGEAISLSSEAAIVPPGRSDWEIHYTALSLTSPEKNRFKYQLEGADASWVQAGGRRVAYYNHLRPGKYRFHVIACNNDGVWNESGATAAIVLKANFWQTEWFYGAAALIAAGAVGGAARSLTRRKLQRKLDNLQRQHALDKERARIARDMHDGLGSDLANLVLLSQRLERDGPWPEEARPLARQLTRNVQQAIRVMDQIIWAVNPENDSVGNLADYFSDYAQNYLESVSMRCRLDIATGLPERGLSTQVRHELFLAFKEALNNAVKHSQGTEIRLSIHRQNGTLHVGVEDNGRGFEAALAGGGGDGLRNMRQRMEAIQGKFALRTESGKGTRVELVAPLPPAEEGSSDSVMSTHY